MNSSVEPWAQTVNWRGMPAIFVRSPDGATAMVLLHGAHLVSWCDPSGRERLFVSERAVAEVGKAVRGGVPVIFPQFESHGPLPRHGFARTTQWRQSAIRRSEAGALIVMELTDNEATRVLWPHAFSAELTFRFSANHIDIELAVSNTSLAPLSFTAALHTYLQVDDIGRVAIEGLQDVRFLDSLRGGSEQVQPHLLLQIDGEIDRIYLDAGREVLVTDGASRRRLRQAGFHDVVVWNPGPDKCSALADMSPQGFKRMVCVEAAAIGRPIELLAGEQWVGRQSIDCID